ncbi:MAG: nucleotidyl transferase AbiEii/AbiGii toxin family protein [Sedimenticolaceae bacterium]
MPKPRKNDFYDIRLLSQSFPFDDDRLARAIAATFERGGTEIPAELPDALTSAFAEDEHKQRQWNVFLENVALHPGSLADVIVAVAGFIMPHAIAAAKIGRNR